MRQEYADLKEKISKLHVSKQSVDTYIQVGNHTIGGNNFTLIAGPCAVESSQQMHIIAQAVKAHGAHILRGGAYKPRTSPYSFQGLGHEGVKLLKEIATKYDMPIITEVVDAEHVPEIAKIADILQIGSRNMQNFALLKAVGQCKRPVLLKRGLAATVEEFLFAAEYILHAGNPEVILCERGIRTYESTTRNTLDLNAVAILKNLTHLPVLVDPSHGTGITDIMLPMSKAALACGANGVMLEVHHHPESALSDGDQALIPSEFGAIATALRKMHHV